MFFIIIFIILFQHTYESPSHPFHYDISQDLNLDNVTYNSAFADLLPFFGLGRGISLLETNVAEVVFGPPPYPLRTQTSPGQSYDYVIVGGGSAGCVLASRLSEDPETKVLLIEAGGEESGFSTLPLSALFLRKSKRDWGFQTALQANAARGLIGQSVPVPQGKCIGGGSAINGMIYSRGNPLDYEQWAEMGAEGWSWSDMFPYFVKSENKIFNRKSQSRYQSSYHGTRGPLTISTPTEPLPTDILYFEAIAEAGLNIGDYNGNEQARFNYADFTIRNGTRCSAARAYLGPAYDRKNLDVMLNSVASRVLFDRKRAFGVIFEREGKMHVVRARKEVIISAGAYNTPKILMLSGIGPKKQLLEHGIPVLVDSPGVGHNLQDHPFTLMSFTTTPRSSVVYTRLDQAAEAALQFARNRTGLFTLPASEVIGFYRTPLASDDRPDIEIHQTSVLLGGSFPNPLLGYLFNIQNQVVKDYFSPHGQKDGIVLKPTLLQPSSTGWVRLRSDDPADPPIINHRLLSDEGDVAQLIEGCKLVHKISETKAMKEKLAAEPLPNTLPGCEMYKLMTEEYFDCLVRTLTFTMFHGCCTAKMGSLDDRMAVLDSKLRVKGVSNLRVVDSSVMPKIVSGNMNAPVIALAERAADLIKGQILKRSRPPIYDEINILKYLEVKKS